MSRKGIDVSQYQGNIEWEKVKKEFVILRLGWIGNKENHTLDTKFETYLKSCEKYKIPVGVYVYCYANNETSAKSGAEWTIKQLKKYKANLQLPVYIDMEDSSIKGLGKSKLTNIVKAFNTIIEQNGLWAGVYANLDWFTNYLNKEEIKKKYTTWIAHYGVSEDKYEGQYDMMQYTSSGIVDGIKGKVDKDKMYRDLISDIAKTGTTSQKTEGNIKYYPKSDSKKSSIVEALNLINVKSDYNTRKQIAVKNGVINYTGTASQNIYLLSLLKLGKLKAI